MPDLNRENSFFIKDVRLMDPAHSLDQEGHLHVEQGRVVSYGSIQLPKDSRIPVYDGAGCIVTPGMVDVHAHFREPGFEYKETIETGSRAAVAGGFTAVCVMANTDPVNDHPGVTLDIIRKADDIGICRVFPIGAVSIGLKGETLTEMGSLSQAGCIAFSDDGYPVKTSRLLRRALEYSAIFNRPVIDHCEDRDLSDGGVMNEGWVATELGLRGIPNASEEVVVARDLEVVKTTNGHLHVAHLSTAGGVRLVREAKRRHLKVTAETCPHYFALTDEAVRCHHADAKMNPPLRSEEDRLAIIEGLLDGTIDMIATDHAPHAPFEKEREFDQAPFGIIGLETALSLGLVLVQEKIIDLGTLLYLMSVRPAKVFGLPRGEITPGGLADLVVFEPDGFLEAGVPRFHSRSRNSPFRGRKLPGRIRMTFVGGRKVFDCEKEES
ncbi:MAG: dihydroorotase [Leptospirales bacterium]